MKQSKPAKPCYMHLVPEEFAMEKLHVPLEDKEKYTLIGECKSSQFPFS
jgi:hypothetical protein